jgi:hypothetical protein
MLRAIVFSVVVSLFGTSSHAFAQLAPSQRDEERKGRAAFTAGRYQESSEIFARLYADYNDPIYLRNLGRCYQRLGDPPRAIAAFEEYLARKNVSDDERVEVAGFIRELQRLQEEPRKPPPSAPSPPVVGSPPVPAPLSVGAPISRALMPVYASASPALAPRPHAWRRAGQVTLVASAVMTVAAGAVLVSSLSKFSDADARCSQVATSDCYEAVKGIRSRNLIAGALFMGAGFAAATGAFMILLQPTATPDSTAMSGAVLVGAGRF